MVKIGGKNKVAYAHIQFPKRSETFVWREIDALEKAGAHIVNYSMKQPFPDEIDDDTRGFIDRTVYLPHFLAPAMFISHVRWMLKRPAVYFSTLTQVLAARYPPGNMWLAWRKPLIFWRAVHLARMIDDAGDVGSIHAHFKYVAIYAWIAGRLTGIPFSFTAHFAANALLVDRIAADARFVIAVSERERGILRDLMPAGATTPIHVIRLGLPRSYFEPVVERTDDGPTRVVSVGRLIPKKGFDKLLISLANLKGGGVDFRAEIIGDGPLRAYLEAQRDRLELGDLVKFSGARDQAYIRAALDGADIFALFCSHGPDGDVDGLPVAMMEAMARGLPVVTTEVSSLAELVENGSSGFTVPENDTAAFAEALEILINDNDLRSTMGRSARHKVETEYTLERQAREVGELYGQALNGGDLSSDNYAIFGSQKTRSKKMKKKLSILFVLLTIALTSSSITSCDVDKDPGKVQEAGAFDLVGFKPSQDYLTRKAAYLEYCNNNNGPGMGGIAGQVCRVYKGETTFNEDSIRFELTDKILPLNDTADFQMAKVLRILYLDRQNPVLPAPLRAEMEDAVLAFKYWYDETDPAGNTTTDDMCWWSENHQILFNSAELLAGKLFPDRVFTHSGMTGLEHVAHAEPLVNKWLDRRAKFGFSEWHSNVYFNEDMPPLVNLVDFANDKEISLKAAIVLDIMAMDMAFNFYEGLFATTKGRSYPSKFVGGINDSIREAAWLLTNSVPIGSIDELNASHFTAAFLATSDKYYPPPILEKIATDSYSSIEHRQRDSINVADGPSKYGISHTAYEDMMFWWAMEGYLAPELIESSFNFVDHYEMWDDYLWSDLEPLKDILAISPPLTLAGVAEDLRPMFGGIVLEEVNTYTYRTPYYQLSGAQDYKPFSWTGQVVPWMGTLNKDCFIITAFPMALPPEIGLADFGSEWTGGFMPRVTMYENVGVIQYHKPVIGSLEDYLFEIPWDDLIPHPPHAYIPTTSFDEINDLGNNWHVARSGDSYVAFYISDMTGPGWVSEFDYVTGSTDAIFIIEFGDVEQYGDFAAFVAAFQNATVDIGLGHVEYQSPSQGLITVGWFGPMIVDGAEVDLGPYDRWDNQYVNQDFGTMRTVFEFKGKKLVLDAENLKRGMIK